jgi:hypothetical protein
MEVTALRVRLATDQARKTASRLRAEVTSLYHALDKLTSRKWKLGVTGAKGLLGASSSQLNQNVRILRSMASEFERLAKASNYSPEVTGRLQKQLRSAMLGTRVPKELFKVWGPPKPP